METLNPQTELLSKRQAKPQETTRTCYCGQLLMGFAIKCPSRQDCHVENVERAQAQTEKNNMACPRRNEGSTA